MMSVVIAQVLNNGSPCALNQEFCLKSWIDSVESGCLEEMVFTRTHQTARQRFIDAVMSS